jgi:hypothetical protein
MVYYGTLFIGDNRAFLCIPMKMKTGAKFEHRTSVATTSRKSGARQLVTLPSPALRAARRSSERRCDARSTWHLC